MNQSETFGIALITGSLTSISGEVQPHSLLMGSVSDDGNDAYIYANGEIGAEYPDSRSTLIEMNWLRKPTVSVSPASALEISIWQDNTLSFSETSSE